ncbi:glycosyltransferase [Thermodesulfobacteriota bacterium]
MNNKNKINLFIIDPNISNQMGHYAEYAMAIYNSAQKQGYDVKILAHCTASKNDVQNLNAIPVFRFNIWHSFVKSPRLSFIINTPIANWTFYQDLTTSLNLTQSRKYVVFMPTFNHRHMLAWSWWLNHVPTSIDLQLVLLFRYSYYEVGRNRPWSFRVWWARIGIFFLRWAARRCRFHLRLAADSHRLAQEYRKLTSLPIEIFPIPHTTGIVNHKMSNLTAKQRPIRFVFLGDAREEKGFSLIAEAILELHKHNQLNGIEFILQCYISSEVHAAMKLPRQKLIDLCLPQIQLILEPLTRDSYNNIIDQADVVLLPYSRRIYYSRTSGPFAEALAAGKPVIVPRDTWMSDQVVQYGAGIMFKSYDFEDLIRAITAIRDGYPSLAKRAQIGRSKWTTFHNPDNFVRLLMNGL